MADWIVARPRAFTQQKKRAGFPARFSHHAMEV